MSGLAGMSRPMRLLAAAALLEGATLLFLLFVAVPLKHLGGVGSVVPVAGPVHGVAFMTFAYLLVEARSAGDLDARQARLAAVAAFLPFGGILSAAMFAKSAGRPPA